MEDKLIKFQTAKLAKEKGFKEKVFFSYDAEEGKPILYYGDHEGKPDFSFRMIGYPPTVNYELFNHNKYKKDKTYSVPTQSLLQRWLREKHSIHIEIEPLVSGKYLFYLKEFKDKTDLYLEYENYNKKYLSYEEALEEALLQGLNLIENE